jgi:hypothetical protein
MSSIEKTGKATQGSSPGQAGYARSSDAPLWSCSQTPDRQIHATNVEWFPRSAIRLALSNLHRVERMVWVTSPREKAPDRKREFECYCLTKTGRTQLVVEESLWRKMDR